MSQWTNAFPLSELSVGGARLFKRGHDQVAVFRTTADELHAVDNRCPHEGYPLTEGALDGCTLTCCWHNFKFDLRTGSCLKGDEDVRTFPVRIAGDRVELDLTPPDPSKSIERLWTSLEDGLHNRRVGQCTRDGARLILAGVEPAEIAAFVAAFNGVRAEYGSTHVLAVAADVLQWHPHYPGPRFAIPLAQLFDLASRDGVRRPIRPAASPVDPGDDAVAAGVALRKAVEAEDADRAEALLLGALERGWQRTELEPWFFALCADHFLSFGHRLIYQIKVFDLLDAAGRTHAAPILRGHLFGIVSGTREDVLPAWRSFRTHLAKLDLAALYASAGGDPSWEGGELVETLLVGRPADAMSALTRALSEGAPLEAVIDAISVAAAERMLRFDVSIDSDPSNQDNWLSVTHIQTFANAVRHAAERFDHPDLLRMVFHAARFVNHHRVLDCREPPTPIVAAPTPDVKVALAAILSGRTDEALSQCLAVIEEAPLLEALRHQLMDVAISDRFAAPIVSAHAMKNLVVAFEEYAVMGDPRSVLAVVRLLSSPVQQRWTHRGALEAVAFVTEGKTPTLLAP